MNPLEKLLPTSTDPSILDELYSDTPIIESLTLEDLLKLPVNEEYNKCALYKTAIRFKIKQTEPEK